MTAAAAEARAAAGWSAWPAPAKLNLFLHIVGRRGDGYHLLQTAFQLLDWGDTVHLRLRQDGAIHRLDPLPGVAAANDLAVRAARALQVAGAVRQGVDIAIDKRIPCGGGLGGGSSDAATALVALNRLWRCGLDEDALAALGQALGADVPVFVRGRSAWAEGIGERLTPIELPPRWFVLIDPGVTIATAELFAAADLTRDAPRLTISRFTSGATTANAFEPVVRARFAAVAQALDWLDSHRVKPLDAARLSGSGGCIFAPVASPQDGAEIVGECPSGMRGFVVRALTESPLMERMREWQDAG